MNQMSIKNPTILTIIVSNLLFLIAVFVFKWDSLSVFILYIIETVIIGIMHVFKLFTLTFVNSFTKYQIKQAASLGSLVGSVLFFIFNFGLLVLLQTTLVLKMHNHNVIDYPQIIRGYFQGEFLWFLALITILHLGATIRYIFIDNAYEGKSFEIINKEAYPRVYFQQFLVMIGFILIAYVGLKGIGGLISIIGFIVIKAVFEILAESRDVFKSKKSH